MEVQVVKGVCLPRLLLISFELPLSFVTLLQEGFMLKNAETRAVDV